MILPSRKQMVQPQERSPQKAWGPPITDLARVDIPIPEFLFPVNGRTNTGTTSCFSFFFAVHFVRAPCLADLLAARCRSPLRISLSEVQWGPRRDGAGTVGTDSAASAISTICEKLGYRMPSDYPLGRKLAKFGQRCLSRCYR